MRCDVRFEDNLFWDAAGMNISVIGLGKLGLCSAVCFASRGHKVIGVDRMDEHVLQLQGGECPIDEPGLADMLSECRDNHR